MKTVFTTGAFMMAACLQSALAQQPAAQPPKPAPGPTIPATKPKSAEMVNGTYMAPEVVTTPPIVATFIDRRHYQYTESRFDPAWVIQPTAKDQADYSTPEGAMAAKASALAALDYDWWLDCWDPASREFLMHQPGKDKKYWLEQWNAQYLTNRFKLLHRVELRGYVILTYTLVDAAGGNVAQGFEIPSFFKKVGDRWYSTQELSSDPLPQLSPWVTGRASAEAEVR